MVSNLDIESLPAAPDPFLFKFKLILPSSAALTLEGDAKGSLPVPNIKSWPLSP